MGLSWGGYWGEQGHIMAVVRTALWRGRGGGGGAGGGPGGGGGGREGGGGAGGGGATADASNWTIGNT